MIPLCKPEEPEHQFLKPPLNADFPTADEVQSIEELREAWAVVEFTADQATEFVDRCVMFGVINGAHRREARFCVFIVYLFVFVCLFVCLFVFGHSLSVSDLCLFGMIHLFTFIFFCFI